MVLLTTPRAISVVFTASVTCSTALRFSRAPYQRLLAVQCIMQHRLKL